MQMVFLFGLYPVVQYVTEFVTKVRDVYTPVIQQIQATNGYEKIMETVSKTVVPNIGSFDLSTEKGMANVLYKFQNSTWDALVDKIPSIEGTVKETVRQVSDMNYFLGIDIGSHPWELLKDALAAASVLGIILAIIIPVLAGVTQFISVKLTQMGASGAALRILTTRWQAP